VARHARDQPLLLVDVGVDDSQPRIIAPLRVVPLRPDEKLSYRMTRSVLESPRSRSVRWLPMKPAPPTIR
jgi:hypothetical protein